MVDVSSLFWRHSIPTPTAAIREITARTLQVIQLHLGKIEMTKAQNLCLF